MIKKLPAIFLCILILSSFMQQNALATGETRNFPLQGGESSTTFYDVPDGAWYAEYLNIACGSGLFNGKSEHIFDPEGQLTIAESLKLADTLYSVYHYGKAEFVQGTPWYQVYADFAIERTIIVKPFQNYNAYITREQLIELLTAALPQEAFPAINNLTGDDIPDCNLRDSYGPAAYELYRAGVLTGGDGYGALYPRKTVTRAESAAIVARVVQPDLRRHFDLTATPSAEELYVKTAPAVFYIECYDTIGRLIRYGSGFFIDSDGLAVTNFHVISGSYRAVVRTSDNKTYAVGGFYDYNPNTDLALLQINGSGFPYLSLGDSDLQKTGETVYAIGNPLGLANTMSQGILSYLSRELGDGHYLQYSAQISYGSGGGALLNEAGKVIGVTSSTMLTGQNLNLAVPSNYIWDLKHAKLTSLTKLVTG